MNSNLKKKKELRQLYLNCSNRKTTIRKNSIIQLKKKYDFQSFLIDFISKHHSVNTSHQLSKNQFDQTSFNQPNYVNRNLINWTNKNKQFKNFPPIEHRSIYQKFQLGKLNNYQPQILLKKIPFFIEGNFWKNQFLINFFNKNFKQTNNYKNKLIKKNEILFYRIKNIKTAYHLITHQCQWKLLLSRPLLYLNRFDIKQLSQFWNLPIYPDKTNMKLQFRRNRIRKQLLPLLRFFFNRQIDQILYQFTELTLTEKLYLDYLSIRLINNYSNNVQKLKKDFDIVLFDAKHFPDAFPLLRSKNPHEAKQYLDTKKECEAFLFHQIKNTKFTNKKLKKFFIYYLPLGIRKRIFRKIFS